MSKFLVGRHIEIWKNVSRHSDWEKHQNEIGIITETDRKDIFEKGIYSIRIKWKDGTHSLAPENCIRYPDDRLGEQIEVDMGSEIYVCEVVEIKEK